MVPWGGRPAGKKIRFFCQTLNDIQSDNLISLHPKMDSKNYKFIETEFGLPIASEPLAEILPVADIFFAAAFSSTIQWAILCKIPTVAYNIYENMVSWHDHLRGVKTINRDKDLRPALETLILNSGYYSQMVEEQARQSKYISPFDGKCTERIVDAIVRLSVNQRGERDS